MKPGLIGLRRQSACGKRKAYPVPGRRLITVFVCTAAAYLSMRATAQEVFKGTQVAPFSFKTSSLPSLPMASKPPSPPPPPPPPPPAVLRWNNGETLIGEVGEATEVNMAWKTPLFEDPLLLAWHALHRIDQALPDSTTTDAFRFVLRDGSHLYGDLTGVTAETVTIHSARHGDATLRRAEVLSVRRIKGEQLVFAGPLGESGWAAAKSVSPGRENTEPSAAVEGVPTRRTGPGGTLVLPFWHRTFFCGLSLPDRMEVDFRVRSKERPAFQFVVETGAKQRLRVETWGDDLVLTASNGFEKIRTLGEPEREVALRLCWDRPAGRCQVYTPEGLLLKEWTVPAERGGSVPGVLLENKGAELTLDQLRVRAWDGQPLPAVDAGSPRVELDDGRTLAGNVDRVEAGALRVPATGEGPPASFPLDGVDAIIFSNDDPSTNPGETTLTYTDGTFLRGHLAGIKDGSAMLKTGFTDVPLAAKTDGLRQVFIQSAGPAGTAPEPALKTLDKIVMRGTTVHGRLQASGDAFARWMPVGGMRPAMPSRTLASEITRTVAPETVAAQPTSLFYTRMGDVLPGVLHGLDRSEVEFESPLIEARKLPAEQLEAVQFNVSNRGAIKGFDAPGWRVLKGPPGLERNGDGINLVEDSAVGHPAAMQNGEVQFTYDTTDYSCLRLRMFCDGTDPARAVSYIIYHYSNQMATGVESTEGQFFNQTRTVVQRGPVTVRLAINEKGVRVYFNNALAEMVPAPAARRAGSGLIIEPASMWGNQARDVSLSKFSAVSEPGQNFLQNVNPDVKTQAMTVPRFRKDDPPRHALLAANGDLLRGEIEAITNTQLGFRIGLETLRIPRDRVRAVVALQKPLDTTPAKDEGDPVVKLLGEHMDQQNWFSDFNTLVNVLQQKVPELKFKLPPKTNTRRLQFQFGNQTVGDALDALCDRFDMSYHIANGMVVIGPKAQAVEGDMIQKVYWLKSSELTAKGSAHNVLAAAGITFADGASVNWQESSRQLAMTNTPANQEKLAGLLANEFGGMLGSPTHWLLMTNGARMALTVEKFEPDVISGTHPVYGRCSVPMSEVYSIRNTMPDLTTAGRAVNGWQLVYAPEPVLPQNGGEGSALLGKDAPTFKLSMLGGGDFDLSQQKGKVVVLDFWATWCGPCIKSLPGLIETMAQFPADRVKMIGLNQAEAPDQVKRFVETRGWKLEVAMDTSQNVARQYGVDGIPHTVIIGPDGKVAWVRTGYDPEGDAQAAEAVKKLLAAGTGTQGASVP